MVNGESCAIQPGFRAMCQATPRGRRCSRPTILMLWLALGLARGAEAWSSPGTALASAELGPRLAVTWVATAPVIDGQVSPGEWATAASAIGWLGFSSRRLEPTAPVVLCAYDAAALYVAALVPLPEGAQPKVAVLTRDGPVYRDDAVEVILAPEPDGPLRHVAINAAGSVFDQKGADTAWSPEWPVKVGRGALPAVMGAAAGARTGWWLELALPFRDLGVDPPGPGALWRANLCVDGQRHLVYAPTFASHTDRERYAYLRFVGPDEPGLQVAGLEDVCYGRLNVHGTVTNPAASPIAIRFDAEVRQPGTTVSEHTGFDQIQGALIRLSETLDVPPRQTREFSWRRTFDRRELTELHWTIAGTGAAGLRQELSGNTVGFAPRAPLQLVVDSYPSRGYAVARLDAAGLEPPTAGSLARWELVDAAGALVWTHHSALPEAGAPLRLDLATLAPGTPATLRVHVVAPDGTQRAVAERTVTRVESPQWVREPAGTEREVPEPFAPVLAADRTVSTWGRTYRWQPESLLPTAVVSTGVELLAGPARLVVDVDGHDECLPLDRFEVSAAAPDRVDLRLGGRTERVAAEVLAWVEYDGLLWVEVTLTPLAQPRPLGPCRLELPLSRHDRLYYHAVPDRAITGAVPPSRLDVPFQYFFWVGSCDRGLGFVTEAFQEGPGAARRAVYGLEPANDRVVWSVRLAPAIAPGHGVRVAFGLQATPVKPLPAGWHSWVAENLDGVERLVADVPPSRPDLAAIWETFRGSSEHWWRDAFCDPAGIRHEAVKRLVERARRAGVPAVLYYAPLDFTADARDEHARWGAEWRVEPLSQWTSAGFVQTRACSRSSFADYFLAHLRDTLRATGLAGVYFDGAMSEPCANPHHGCGWVDAAGVRHPTLQILENRAFNRRVATVLSQDSRRRAGAGTAAGWQQWTHVSGAVCPPITGTSTAHLCGEWFKGPLRAGKRYRDLLTLDTFRPRYLSTPWGIPNFFLPITRETQGNETTETEFILSYLLPHGVPLYPRYLNPSVVRDVLRIKADFGTREADFTPCWRPSAGPLCLEADLAPEALLACWRRDGRVLAVVSNVGGSAVQADVVRRGGGRLRALSLYPVPAGTTATPSDGDRVSLLLAPGRFQFLQVEWR